MHNEHDKAKEHLTTYFNTTTTALISDKEDAQETVVTEARERKTVDEYTLQANYGYGDGWEDITSENNYKDIKAAKKEYEQNEGKGPYKIIKRRVKKVQESLNEGNFAYDVYNRKGKLIDTVFFVDQNAAEEVKTDLINHDGYPSDIVVREVKKKK